MGKHRRSFHFHQNEHKVNIKWSIDFILDPPSIQSEFHFSCEAPVHWSSSKEKTRKNKYCRQAFVRKKRKDIRLWKFLLNPLQGSATESIRWHVCSPLSLPLVHCLFPWGQKTNSEQIMEKSFKHLLYRFVLLKIGLLATATKMRDGTSSVNQSFCQQRLGFLVRTSLQEILCMYIRTLHSKHHVLYE